MSNTQQKIFSNLIDLGCPLLLEHNPCSPSNLAIYFSPCPSRYKLLEWLLAICGHPIKEHTLEKVSLSLWKLGLNPVLRNSQHFDYKSYIQGTLGSDSAKALILHLTQLAVALRKIRRISQKQDQKLNKGHQQFSSLKEFDRFNRFLDDLIMNASQLINVDQSVYDARFPPLPGYGAPEYADYIQKRYKQEIQPLIEHLSITITNPAMEEGPDNDAMLSNIFRGSSETEKKLFAKKSEEVVELLKELKNKREVISGKLMRSEKAKVDEL